MVLRIVQARQFAMAVKRPRVVVKADPVKVSKRLRVKAEASEPEIKVKDEEKPTFVKVEDIEDAGESTEPAGPKDWFKIYSLVREMRAVTPAPVDTMGCERIPDHAGPLSEKDRRFHLLITLMLSSQTKDEVNAKVMARLRDRFKDDGGLCLDNIRKIDEKELDTIIFPVGFHSRKAKYIKESAEILVERFNSDIPETAEDMMSLPGVGPKMAYLLRTAAWGITDGIGVDVHVHRLANMWRWVPKEKTPTPEKTRLALEAWLPKEYWREINWLLVGFGQTICPSQNPKCDQCTIAPTGMCKNVKIKRK